jgi:hypothetical protein
MAFVLSLGCQGWKPVVQVGPTDRPNPTSAYLYGRFYNQVEAKRADSHRYQTLGLDVQCADGKDYTIRFSNRNGVQVIEAAPGRCALIAILFLDLGGTVRKRKSVPPSSALTRDFVAGTAHYLGDFFAKTDSDAKYRFMYWDVTTTWQLTDVDDNYDGTTAQLRRTFVNLASLPTENTTLVPLTRLPGQPRSRPPAGPSTAPAPPAVPSRGSGEDLMTPDRIARIAPFTKRRYATPEECEAACPTGECLPYRTEEGPVMTCIVRCKADRECPPGLACNCPRGNGPDCRSIARTPTDAMAGICLSIEPTGERR